MNPRVIARTGPGAACSAAMNRQQFWQLIEAARNQASDPNDGEGVAHHASAPAGKTSDPGGAHDLVRGWRWRVEALIR